MSKELILVIASSAFLILAFYAIDITNRLPVSSRKKQILYWTSLIIPLLGYFLARYYQKKKANSNG